MEDLDSGYVMYRNKDGTKSGKLSYTTTIFNETNYSKITSKQPSIKYKAAFEDPQFQSFASYALKSASNNLQSLKELCIECIAHNFDLVDCFKGLPDIIGKDIFDCVIKCISFDDLQIDLHGKWKKVIRVFVAAYGSCILKSFNLSQKWLFLAVNSEIMFSFVMLQELDLSSCRLGNSHDIIFFVGKLDFLQKLSLRNNSLTNCGIKNLTAFRRRAKKGLLRLKVLHVESNNITSDVLMYLQLLPNLEIITADLNVSGCFVSNIKTDSEVKFRKCYCKNDHDPNVFRKCSNEGWVASYLESYIKQVDAAKKQHLSRIKFYHSKQNYVTRVQQYVCENSDYVTLCTDHDHHKPFSKSESHKLVTYKTKKPSFKFNVNGNAKDHLINNISNDETLLSLYRS